ncbi:ABC transporter permease [Patulibacter defluvii]|uniref:ABC transporter permease n=1 Tax=Patulibacter defluvii TaxID=3095358 RepID=UPI002A754311|nr:ABC transporter permease [Patulibacter sp. DM4]
MSSATLRRPSPARGVAAVARFWRRHGSTPLRIGLALLILYLWMQGQEIYPAVEDDLTASSLARFFGEHLKLVGISAVVVLAVGVPLGVLVTRRRFRRAAPVVLALANAGQSAPSIGLIVIFVSLFGVEFVYVVLGLVVYALLPIVRNTIEGLRAVDPGLLDAARGQGFSRRQVLLRVELPLAVPYVLAGIRTALVLLVGTATLATFFDAGGLGTPINDGIKFQSTPVIVTGAVLAASLAIFIDWLAGIAEQYLSPRGLRKERS